MRDLDKALADILAIRSQIAAGTAFRGYGPTAVAGDRGLALVTALLQHLWLDDPTAEPLAFFAGWAATALLSGALIWIEMRARSYRHHSGLADAMIHQAFEQFVPAGVAGALLAVMLLQIRAGGAVDAARTVAIAGGTRRVCFGPLAAPHRRLCRRLVFPGGLFDPAARRARATHCRHGPWACRSWRGSS